MSLAEAVANVIVGYGVAVVTQIIVFPWFGLEAALGEQMAIGLAFVGVSLARGYLLRRLFERLGKTNMLANNVEHEPSKRS
jgi:hypothetical protein